MGLRYKALPPCFLKSPSDRPRLQTDTIIDSITKPLLAAKVSLGCLNRDMPKQELHLLKFAASLMA